jgi:hypothetical protein
MSLDDWELQLPPKWSEGEPPPLWLYALLYVVIELIGIAFTVFNWPKGQPTMTGAFWANILLVPALFWVGVSGLLYWGYEGTRSDALQLNHMRCECEAHWYRWAHAHLVLIDSVTLTPEGELAERMLGLEGTAPQNPDKMLTLPNAESGSGQSRLEQVLAQLLHPLAGALTQCLAIGKFDIVLQTGSETHAAELQRTWRKLGLTGNPKVTWLPTDADSPMAGQWFDDDLPDFRLVLSCQLHDGTDTPSWSETAAALLLATSAKVAKERAWLVPRFKLKPQAYLFRPVSAESDALAKALETLLHAGQVPNGKIRHAWFSRLDKLLKHAVITAIRDTGLSVGVHDVDRAVGKPGPANRWLLPALAAQMVRHGQGAQLIAIPHQSGVALSVVAAQPAPPVRVPDFNVPLVSVGWVIGLSALACGLAIAFSQPSSSASDSSSLRLWMLIASLLLILLQPAAELLKRHFLWKANGY